MYFNRKKGKQVLDLHGQLILSRNDDLIACVSKSAGPVEVKRAHYIMLEPLSFWQRIKASCIAVRYVWKR